MSNRFARIRSGVTYANVVATLAVFVALGGTSYATVLYTGANVKNGSLTGPKFASSKLTASDMSIAAKARFVGPQGSAGWKGIDGSVGSKGAQGPTGDPGAPAALTSTWAWQDTGLTTDATTFLTPNPTNLPWDDPAAANGANIRLPGSYTAVDMTRSWTSVDSLGSMSVSGTGQTGASQGLLVMPFAGNVMATTTMTFLHRNNGEAADTTGGTSIHGRLKCWIGYGSGAPNAATYTAMGTPTYVSSALPHELVDVSLVGNAQNVPVGSYNVATFCRDDDFTGSTQWSLDNANMTAIGGQ